MKGHVILLQFLFFFLLLPSWCGAVQSYTPVLADPVVEPWRWRHETVLDDLDVLCMDEAGDGTLWFGNVGSIASYDGTNVTVIPFDEGLLSKITGWPGIPRTKALLVLPNGSLLVLIDKTLVLRTGDGWRVIIQDVGPSEFTSKLIQTGDGTVWLMVPGALWRVNETLSEVSKVMTAAGYRRLESFCIDGSGDLWVVEKTAWDQIQLVRIPSLNGRVKEEERQTVQVPFRCERGEFNVISRSDGTLVLAASQHMVGLHLFDPVSGRWETKSQNSQMWSHYSLHESHDGSVWVGLHGEIRRLTQDKKLVEYPDLKFELPQVPLTLFEASNQRLWVIGRIGQVCSVDLRASEWATYLGLNFEFETADGVQWFRSKSVHHVISHTVHSGEWLQYGTEDGVVDRVHLLFQSSRGLIWAAGSHEERAAISVFDGVQWTRQVYPGFAELILPNGAFESSDGTVWFGAQGRLLDEVPHAGGALQFRITDEGGAELLKHHTPTGFPYYVTAFAQTPDETLWIGSTLIQSVDREGSVRVFPELQGENTVAMAVDREQALWVAKEHFGICRWRGDSWDVFTKKDGLPDLKLSDMLVLQDGSLLVASSQAISRFDGTSWFSDVYPEWFGMSSRWSSLKTSRDGSIWFNYASNDKRMSKIFPGTAGCCAIRHRPETDAPDTRIADYLQRVSPPGNTHITWTAQDLWRNTSPKKLQYSWRLDGEAWSPFSYENGKTFLSLSDGRHVLEVRARDQSFNVDPTPDRIAFSVIPPVWKRTWFVALISVLVGLIVLMVLILIRVRERNSKERQAEREAFLVKQQQEREQNLIRQQREKEKSLIERQQEHEALLMKQQEQKEFHLKEMDRIKTGFFTNISHELRTPMTVISGRLQMIFNSDIDEKTKASLSIALRNAHRVSTLITQLLDFRKIQEGKIKVETTQGDLIPPLHEWVTSLQVLAEQAQLSLSLESPAECRGWFDFDKLQKICTNLVANSIKYTNSGGAVHVILQDEQGAGGRQLKFVVEDTGRGISAEHLPHIFDRFYRVSEASMAAGAGIGLNLTKELVALLGGQIRVDSPIHPEADRPGTRFTVCLPIEQVTGDEEQGTGVRRQEAGDSGHEESLRSTDEKTVDEDRPLILVVEDDEDIRAFIVEGLAAEYQVHVADNGLIGLQKAKELVPDLIITDVMMPEMDGISMCRELKTSIETSHIPVIMLTAKAALENQLEGLKTGADDYIVKPFHMNFLLVRLANLLASRKRLREQFCRTYSVITPKIPENTPEKEFLDKAMSVVQENYADEEFNPETLASLMHMGLRTLQRKLKAVTDHTPIAFINEYRIIQAAELLKETNSTIADITFDVGYDDPSNFARMFKKHFGVSPSDYRAEHRSA